MDGIFKGYFIVNNLHKVGQLATHKYKRMVKADAVEAEKSCLSKYKRSDFTGCRMS